MPDKPSALRRQHQRTRTRGAGRRGLQVEEAERVVSVERIADVSEKAADGKEAHSPLSGYFRSPTLGHIDIVERAVKLVDHLVIGVAAIRQTADVHAKRACRDGAPRDQAACRKKARTIAVLAFDELLINFAQKVGAGMIVRGLRAVSDFEYEFQMVGMNQRLNPEIETVFLMADPRHQAIASRLVKEIALLAAT